MDGQLDNQASPEPIITGPTEGVHQISIPVKNASGQQSQGAGNAYVNDVKTFFSKNLLQIIKDIFAQPIKGTRSIFENAGNEAYQHGLILMHLKNPPPVAVVMFWWLRLNFGDAE